MSILYNNIERLCKERGETVTSLCRKAGITRTSLSELKSGRTQGLSYKTIKKIADFFGISVIDVTNDNVEQNNGDIDDFAYALYNETRRLTEEQKNIILQLARSMNKKD